MAREKVVWEDNASVPTRQVVWYGGRQVNLYVRNFGDNTWREVGVSSEAQWWGEQPTLADVREHAQELLGDPERFASLVS